MISDQGLKDSVGLVGSTGSIGRRNIGRAKPIGRE